jgi:uncharacterized protein with HEPN domain
VTEQRRVDKIVDDILEAAGMAEEIRMRGRAAWDEDRLLRAAAEAVINRIGDASTKLPNEVKEVFPNIPWDDIRANRVLIAHVYHRINYDRVWETIVRDVPRLERAMRRWKTLQLVPEHQRERAYERMRCGLDRGPEIGF